MPPATPPSFPSSNSLLRLEDLDFSQRTYELRELLDEPCTFADYAAAMRSMGRVNRLTRGFTPLLQLLKQTVARTGVSHEPLHVVDYGCGHGDLLRAAHAWGARHSVPLRLTGIDASPYAARLARESDRTAGLASGEIHWLTGDLFAPLDRPADIAFCSLVAHHLPDADVIRLLQTCAQARRAWIILDLRRSERAARIFRAMGTVLRWHPFIRHDGVVSFARAFSLDEWQSLITQSGVPAELRDLGMGRIAIVSTH